MFKGLIILLFLVFPALLTLPAFATDGGAATFDEGTDTVCEVSYSDHGGDQGSIFLSEGDRIAVISPSALPSREQVDAVIEGLKTWGYIPVEGQHVFEETRTLEDCIEDLKWALAGVLLLVFVYHVAFEDLPDSQRHLPGQKPDWLSELGSSGDLKGEDDDEDEDDDDEDGKEVFDGTEELEF